MNSCFAAEFMCRVMRRVSRGEAPQRADARRSHASGTLVATGYSGIPTVILVGGLRARRSGVGAFLQ